MKTTYTIAVKHLACIILLFMAFAIMSCEDDNVGEFVLSGNIENLIPEDTYDLKKTDTGEYIVYTPDLDSNFEYWGLTLKQVDYYIDDALYKSEMASPWEIMIKKNGMGKGYHKLRAEMRIVGQACDDVILVKEDAFYIPNDGENRESHGDIYIDYNYITKGEELVVTPEMLANRSTEGCKFDKVEYCLNEKFIGKSTSFPHTLDYKLADLSKASHVVKDIFTTKKGDAASSQIGRKTIIITE